MSTDADHRKLRDFVLTLENPWILSYDDLGRVRELYSEVGAGSTNVEVIYSTSPTGGNRIGREVILANLGALPSETRLWRRGAEWGRGERAAPLEPAGDGSNMDNAAQEAVMVGAV